jgi:hypothetical protein
VMDLRALRRLTISRPTMQYRTMMTTMDDLGM